MKSHSRLLLFDQTKNESVPPDGKCIYYNATNPKLILDAYEGIPQTLILNLIGWVVSTRLSFFSL